MSGSRSRDVRLWLECALFAIGVSCLGYYGFMTVEAQQFQQEQSAAFEALLESTIARPFESAPTAPVVPEMDRPKGVSEVADAPLLKAPATTSRATRAAGSLAPGVMALLQIPRLKLSSPVMSGDDEATLKVAIGHLPDTPKPWEPGNSALAAHRDGLFRPLRNIRVGDDVVLRTLEGEFVYRVRETKIVMPNDLSVLAPTEEQTLTLITCYPFNFVGNAPKRFIVHADRVPDPTQ